MGKEGRSGTGLDIAPSMADAGARRTWALYSGAVQNTVTCRCGQSWRFRANPRGLIVYRQDGANWKLWGLWESTIEKFQCRCKSSLHLHR